MISEINPDIMIGPDGFFTFDEHPDHNRTGWLVYFVIKSMEPADRPLLLLYHSAKTNFYIPIKNIGIQVEAWSKHRSQTTPLFNKVLLPLRKLYYTVKRIKTGPVLAEGFRRPSFEDGENRISKFRHKVIYYLVANTFKNFSEKLCKPTPKELGLK